MIEYVDIKISYKLMTGYDQYDTERRIKSVKEWFLSLVKGKKEERQYRAGLYIVVSNTDSRFITSDSYFYASTYNLAVVRKFEETKNPRVLSRLIDSDCEKLCPEEFADKIKLTLGSWEVDGDNYSVKVFCSFNPLVYKINNFVKELEYWYGKEKPDTREDPIYTIKIKKEDFIKKENIINKEISLIIKKASEFYFDQLVRPYENTINTNNNLENEDAKETEKAEKIGEFG